MSNPYLAVTLQDATGDLCINVDMKIPLSGATALFGRSGSGKTTLLRAIAGLTTLEGTVKYESLLWQQTDTSFQYPTHKRRIGYVFQEPSLFSHMSVKENILYGAKRAKRSDTKISFTLDQVSNLMHVEHLLHRSPKKLSGGERQRVSIARALMRQPQLLLMDEPLSALDRNARGKILSCLEQLHREHDIPIIYVSHDIEEVARIADHMILIEDGKNVASGPPETILHTLGLHTPGGAFESSALVNSTLIEHKPDVHLSVAQIGETSISIPLCAHKPGNEVRLRIRARDVSIALRKPEEISIRNILEGTISAIEATDKALVEVQIDIGDQHLKAQITQEALSELNLKAGLKVFTLIKSVSVDGY